MLARYRILVTPLALIAAVVLVYLENPWYPPAAGGRTRDLWADLDRPHPAVARTCRDAHRSTSGPYRCRKRPR